jgi:hypothetical protein
MTEAMSCFQIIHVVRNPNTGVAASIAALAQAQLSAGLDAKLVILKSNSWKPTQTGARDCLERQPFSFTHGFADTKRGQSICIT